MTKPESEPDELRPDTPGPAEGVDVCDPFGGVPAPEVDDDAEQTAGASSSGGAEQTTAAPLSGGALCGMPLFDCGAAAKPDGKRQRSFERRLAEFVHHETDD